MGGGDVVTIQSRRVFVQQAGRLGRMAYWPHPDLRAR